VHEIYRGWRRVADSYDPPRIFVAEAWVPSNERLAKYLRSDELHTAFQFDLLRAPWRASSMRDVIDDAVAAADSVGAASTWVLSNHDVVRHATRYARSQPPHLVESAWDRSRWGVESPDLELGTRRARAAALLTLALPGVGYLYQGEELALYEVEDIPSALRQDPTWVQSGYTDPGRDGCRVPLPWSSEEPPFGFSPSGASAQPWLPQPAEWASLTQQAQEKDPTSTLSLYRSALRLRGELWEGLTAPQWIESRDDVLAFRRGAVECWMNTGPDELPLPTRQVLLASQPLTDSGALPADTAVWLVSA